MMPRAPTSPSLRHAHTDRMILGMMLGCARALLRGEWVFCLHMFGLSHCREKKPMVATCNAGIRGRSPCSGLEQPVSYVGCRELL